VSLSRADRKLTSVTKVTTFGEEEARDDAWTVATAKARLSEVIDRAPTHGPSLLLETGVPQRWWSVLTNGSERPDGPKHLPSAAPHCNLSRCVARIGTRQFASHSNHAQRIHLIARDD